MKLRPAWSGIPAKTKRRVQALIPDNIYEELFVDLLPNYGAATTVVSHLVNRFYTKFKSRITPTMSRLEREVIAQELLKEMTK